MSFVNWSDIYCIGNETLDGHHKRLFEIVSQLHDELLGPHRKEAVDSTIAALLDYTRYHFSEEENIMKAVGFPDYAAHRAVHAAIIQKLQDYERRKNSGDREAAAELYSFLLGDWLWKHILEMDKKIAPYIRKHDANHSR